MHAPWVEQKNAIDDVGVWPVRVAKDDDVGVRKAASQSSGQAGVRVKVAEADGPQKGLWFLHPSRPIAVDDDDPPAFNGEVAGRRQRGELRVVVATNRFHRCDELDVGQRRSAGDISRVDDQIHTIKHGAQALG